MIKLTSGFIDISSSVYPYQEAHAYLTLLWLGYLTHSILSKRGSVTYRATKFGALRASSIGFMKMYTAKALLSPRGGLIQFWILQREGSLERGAYSKS